jgi:hypothetical protein
MFDVLGFRASVKNTSLAGLVGGYHRLQREKLQAATIPVLHAGGVQEWSIATTVFSDTLLVWAKTGALAVDTFLASVSVLVARSVAIGWPLRGGIAVGDCILDRKHRIFLGQPIVDAHDAESAQEWIGAAFHPSCFLDNALGQSIQQHDSVRPYHVPVKSGRAPLEWAVHWGDRVFDARDLVSKLQLACTDPNGHAKYPPTDAYLQVVFP